MKKIGIVKSALAPADWKQKLLSMSCSHVIFTKKKVKASGQQSYLEDKLQGTVTALTGLRI